MTVLLSWNIQYGKGVDGVIDLRRIVETARRDGPVDILCLQEISVGFADLGAGAEVDQVAALKALLPGYAAVFGAPVDFAGPHGQRRRFGNLILSRLPIREAACHILPRPAVAGVQHMQRGAATAVVMAPAGPLRVISTHLEFHSATQRAAQSQALRMIHAESTGQERAPPKPSTGPYESFAAAAGTILCGDFNFELSEASYRAMQAPFDDGTEPLLDAWPICHPDRPHAPTCGIHDHDQWPQGAHARDFVFVSAGLADRITGLSVDTDTAASDHQPIRVQLGA